ncbi:HAD family acid phosphatase [Sphingomonas sanxanigenens]|uniref:Acid phosphatase n=1 Tax=Sphingomonas sanxanigenens DSM 19645 = NX02 TaxID=1123269 RepID=W0A9D5_9SPHN|nr:HAD family acid phosphatase [Sphingomonas sanxanigenens]AHE53087.1 hypothetical protein NX02_06785 [Sphingomonas sanxanigenens DSM 19645 = NX02]
MSAAHPMARRAHGLARAGTALIAASLLQGCVAMAIPAGAAALAGGKVVLDDRKDERAIRGGAGVQPSAAAVPPGGLPPVAVSQPPAPPPPPAPDAGMQFLFGSGEAAALGNQAYNALIARIKASADYRELNFPVASLVLAPGSTLDAPRFVPCENKPLAMVLDIDETALLNIGYEDNDARHGLSYDEERWKRWEATGSGAVAAVPGAVAAIKAARRANVTPVFISNRSTLNAEATARLLDEVGLGLPRNGDTLLLRPDGAGSGKDERRATIAARYCVIAMVGDQLGDFSDLFNVVGMTPAARRAAADNDQLRSLWGAGWYMLPNPVYGTALKGGFDDIFPTDKRWADPAGQGAK